MSIVQPGQGRDSPGLHIDLASNNPFRNRATSPRPPSQVSPLIDQFPSPRPVSRNPFLDNSAPNDFAAPKTSPRTMAPPASTSPLTGSAALLFDNLTLDDKPVERRSPSLGAPPPRPDAASKPGAGRENIPPRTPGPRGPPPRGAPRGPPGPGDRRPPPPGASGRPRAPTKEDIFADPSSSPRRGADGRRPRRNSESSVADRSSNLLDPEDEKRRQRRKERERKARKEREKARNERRLDVIDKLDVTSIYGTGLFHHDGPFDACNPHRNRQGSRRAPMQAFPEGSLNNTLGGGGPINFKPDHAQIMGTSKDDAFNDFNTADGLEPRDPSRTEYTLSSAARAEKIHGDESMGLGTSTFLEGTPASRAAIQRRESDVSEPMDGGGLSRKKSLAQRIRGINNGRRDYGPSGRLTNPEQIYVRRSPGGSMRSPDSIGGEKNPFFTEFSEAGNGEREKKEGVTFAEPEQSGRARAPSSPQPLERRATTDASVTFDTAAKPEGKSIGSGFLSRVKSLKGGPRRPKESGRALD